MLDVNLLVYAYDASSRLRTDASDWWARCLSDAETVGLTHPVLFGFLHVTTSARIFARTMRLSEASIFLNGLLLENDHHVYRVVGLLRQIGLSGGSLVTDVQIAALAIAYNEQVHVAGRDFISFYGLDCRFQLAGLFTNTLRRKLGLLLRL